MSRSHETRVEIDVPIEEVWKAITDPEAMARWFAPSMSVEPGVGGHVTADWGPGMVWKTVIETWEPNRHLRLTETRDRVLSPPAAGHTMEPCRLVEDFFLETENGKTVLRLVHSGFGEGDGWDVEYDGTKAGWAVCFARLKETLERHRDQPVINRIVSRVCDGVRPAEALAALRAAMPENVAIETTAKYHLGGRDFGRNGSFITASVQPTPHGCVAYFEMLLYGVTEREASAIEHDWRRRLIDLFPEPVRA